MSRLEAPLATLGQSEVIEAEAELALPPGTTSVEFLSAVYRDAGQPMHRRLRAAIECAPYCHPKLSVTATVGGKDFAAQLERAIERSGKVVVIEAVESIPESANRGMGDSKRSRDLG
jgi:hypothetical protein